MALELTPEDLMAIDELRDALTGAIVAGNSAAYASLCTENVRLLHPGSEIVSGVTELEAHNADMFEAVSVVSLVLAPVDIHGSGDLAYEVGSQELDIEPKVPGFGASRKYTHILRRGADGQWRFEVLMSNDS